MLDLLPKKIRAELDSFFECFKSFLCALCLWMGQNYTSTVTKSLIALSVARPEPWFIYIP
jgi:hypothetical protein